MRLARDRGRRARRDICPPYSSGRRDCTEPLQLGPTARTPEFPSMQPATQLFELRFSMAFPIHAAPTAMLVVISTKLMRKGRRLALSVSPPPKFPRLRVARLRRLGALSFLPKLGAGDAGALHERLEFRPHDGGGCTLNELRLRESTIRAGDNIFAPNDPGESQDAIGNEARMLDRHRMVSDNAGD